MPLNLPSLVRNWRRYCSIYHIFFFVFLLINNLLLLDEVLAQTFVDVSVDSGFATSNQSSWGSAWGDFNNDGYLDVITTGHNQKDTGSFSQLWLNNGDGTFSDVTDRVGLDTMGDAHGALWVDFDNDGHLDLFVAKGTLKNKSPVNYHELWKNNGNGTFSNIAAPAGVVGIGHRGRGIYAIDYDYDGDLDFFITSFWKKPGDGGNLLYRNNGDLTFSEVAIYSGLSREGEENRTAAWADFDGDGLVDVFLTKPCALFLNLGDGSFMEVTTLSGIDASSSCASGAWGDYDNDGNLDLYVTMSDDYTGVLYRNNGDGTFTDVTATSGIINQSNALGVIWGDYDNDGQLDLYIVNTQNPAIPNRLFRNNGDGTFTDVTSETGAGTQVAGGGTDATFVDYDNDGFLDLFIANGQGNKKGPYVLLRNTGNMNHWIKLNLVGRKSNRHGLMSKVFLQYGKGIQYREHNGPSHYMSQDNLPLHFGLGSQTTVEKLEIIWPSGVSQQIWNVAADQMIAVAEGKSIAFGKPSYQPGVDVGYFIWQEPEGAWQIRWSGGGAKRHFEGIITTDGEFTEVVAVKFNKNDQFTVNSDTIDFNAFASTSQDGLRFYSSGGKVSFDLKMDGVYAPSVVHLGKSSIKPAHMPVVLE